MQLSAIVLAQYATVGESELDDTKLPALLELKYGTPMDAVRELGSVADIRSTFLGFQRGLYDTDVENRRRALKSSVENQI